MDIKSKQDIKIVSDRMHDSEFRDEDFIFDPIERKFTLNTRYVTMEGGRFLKTRSPIQKDIRFHLEFWNVIKCDPIDSNKIPEGRILGGAFNYIKIRGGGKKLTLVSQDLPVVLELSQIGGKFRVEGTDAPILESWNDNRRMTGCRDKSCFVTAGTADRVLTRDPRLHPNMGMGAIGSG
ncbi:MAG: hypothetical protein AMJ65_18830 [Phycisphaerae bacterium SG8_4]|nr:MAG: hypothetical protein AMJ65_18830 [Phycisphaerae bacterium SG8_4]